MSIFRRNDPGSPSGSSSGSDSVSPSHSSSASSSGAAQRRRVTHIAPGTRVVGQLTGPTELLIEGEVEGEIRVDVAVMIGADGVVKGPVSANVVRVGGRIEGNVQAAERVEVAPSGTLEGDITAPRVVIAEGAFFKGRVEMRPQEKKAAEPPPERVQAEKAQPQPEKLQDKPLQDKPPENRRGAKAPAAT
jgi:cytoskeletal protein CcmA (bactofilin family)